MRRWWLLIALAVGLGGCTPRMWFDFLEAASGKARGAYKEFCDKNPSDSWCHERVPDPTPR